MSICLITSKAGAGEGRNAVERAIRIGICEDDDRDARELEGCLLQSGAHRGQPLTITRFDSAEALLEGYQPGRFDALFLDIYLGQRSGLEAARSIRQSDPDCLIMFTTTSQEHALEGYDVQALHYLIKPVSQQAVGEALDRALRQLKGLDEQVISVVVERHNRHISLKDILYIDVHNKQCHIHTRDEVLCVRTTMDQLAELLPMPPFLRCHRSGLVNLGYVRSIDRDFTMQNGDIVCIRQVDLREIKNRYMQYLMDITRNEL